MSRRILYGLCVVLAVLGLSIPLGAWAMMRQQSGPESRLSDCWFRTRPPGKPRADMVMVARDQKTLASLNPTHADYARLIRRLKDAGAKWIVLDVDLDKREGPAADGALWRAIEDSHRTLVMVRYDQGRTGLPNRDEMRGLRALERSSVVQQDPDAGRPPVWGWLNFAPTTSDFIHSAHGAGVAVTEQSLDRDGVMRRSRAGYLAKIQYPADDKQSKLSDRYVVVPSLPVIAAVSALGADKYSLGYGFTRALTLGGVARQPLSSDGFVPVNYLGPVGTYPRVSMIDVLKAEPDAALFRDRIVLVGSTVPGDPLTEERLTPYGTRMPRVEITANHLQSILDRRPLAEPYAAGFAAVAVLGLLLGVFTALFRPALGPIGSLAGLAIYLLGGWVLFATASVMLPLLPTLILVPFAMIVSLALNAWLRPGGFAERVPLADTGMAVGADEDIPDVVPPPRLPARRPSPRYRGRI
jgi:CHASE2 domain-containing sensor protein